ncbi:MAG TPA: hypothetical protein DEB06_09495 [Phycisphaerales bacterium]|nr:hypothetical protein [Phycisphaerales bacterium]
MTSSVTTDFREEYEAERGRLLRRRFLWYAGVVIGLSVSLLIVQIGVFAFVPAVREYSRQFWLQFVFAALSTAVYVTAFFWVRRHTLDRGQTLGLVTRLIVISGALSIIATPAIFEMSRDEVRRQLESDRARNREETRVGRGATIVIENAPAPADPSGAPEPVTEVDVNKRIARQVVLGNALGSIFFTHFFACLFLPWTARESFKPILPLLVLNGLVTLFYIRLVPIGGTISIVLSPLVALPGMAICWWRHSRFRDQFHFQMLKGRYGEMKQDLGFARQIHESMFPQPLRDGPVRFEFRYEPMRQIGGDYLFARRIPQPEGRLPILNLAIVDVTGHGIGAALTVNRLHGEIERRFGADQDSTPSSLLTGLNDYLHHSLATHSVYATALFVRIDPNDHTLRWASAGHPPAFVRTLDGRVDRLDSTTLVLGACKGDDFDPCEQQTRFMPGDVLIAYTDGATEARNQQGRMLGVDGLLRIVASARPDEDGGWASSVLRAVDAHRFGPLQDDTLLVEVYRPVTI